MFGNSIDVMRVHIVSSIKYSKTKADVKTRNKIIDIVNNYEYIAPDNKNTLHNWLK